MADPTTGDQRSSDLVGENPSSRAGLDRPSRPEASGRTREVVDEAKRQASSLAREAKEQGKSVLAEQKQGAAAQLHSVAGALQSAASDLQEHDQAHAGRFVAYAADQLESFGRRIRTKDVDTLISDAEQMGRRSPAAFFAGSVAVGFLLSRFLKSSARARSQEPAGGSRVSDGRTGNPIGSSAGGTSVRASPGTSDGDGGVAGGVSSSTVSDPMTARTSTAADGATASSVATSRIPAQTSPIGARSSSANPDENFGRSS